MELQEVVSSNIKRVGLDDEGLILEYMSGVKYKYKGVTKDLYEKLLQADSKGRFVNSEIKGKFDYEKLA